MALGFLLEPRAPGFYDLAKTTAPIAMEALQRIAALNQIEDRIRGNSPADRRAVRRAESRSLVIQLRAWFEAQIAKLPARRRHPLCPEPLGRAGAIS